MGDWRFNPAGVVTTRTYAIIIGISLALGGNMLQRLFHKRRREADDGELAHQTAPRQIDASQVALTECTFSVVDVETTGLFPRAHHRIIEIAVLRVDPAGQLLDEYVTLVNPERDLGPTDIHGIVAGDVLEAPRFIDIAGDVATRLSGNVFVAHNVQFDFSFLEAEFDRIGHSLPATARLCTMSLAKRTNRAPPSYRLGALCRHFGVPLNEAHSALGDARATAGLLGIFLHEATARRRRTLFELGCDAGPAPPTAWPQLPPSGKSLTRQHASARAEPAYLSQLADRLSPEFLRGTTEAFEYIDLLNRVLEDRRVTEEEADALLDTATRWGLSPDDVRRVHHGYLEALVSVAVEDGVISDLEQRDMGQVARLLGYDPPILDTLIRSAQATPRGAHTVSGHMPLTRESLVGLTVCFTGESRCMIDGSALSRAHAQELATEAGLIVKNSITKKLDLLVVADPHSLSGKARKAREYGIRMIAEGVFWQALGMDVR